MLIARDTDAYVAALGAFRVGMDDQLVRWFSTTLVTAGQASLEWAERLDALPGPGSNGPAAFVRTPPGAGS